MTVSAEQCSKHRSELFDKVGRKVDWRVFAMMMGAIFMLSCGAFGYTKLTSSETDKVKYDTIRLEERVKNVQEDVGEIKQMQRTILEEVRK